MNLHISQITENSQNYVKIEKSKDFNNQPLFILTLYWYGPFKLFDINSSISLTLKLPPVGKSFVTKLWKGIKSVDCFFTQAFPSSGESA